jgi:hypothetical protein
MSLMRPREQQHRRNPEVESMEGRILMSGLGLEQLHGVGAAVLARVPKPTISFNGPGKSAVINAILGGAGHEFAVLALREVRNPLGLALAYANHTITQYMVRGIVLKQINWASSYTGFPHDVLALNVGGGIVLKKQKIELGAIVRGPFTTTPFASSIVFAIDRGAGQRLGPYYPSRPGITPDALVTVTVGPYGQNNSATITDLTTGTTQPISSPVISVAGPTVRILLDASQLPSEGFKLNQYTLAVWTETQSDAPIQDVGRFAPEDSMVPIGVETNVRPTL